jgi:uncharacterized protein YbjT (DUF2867 family)
VRGTIAVTGATGALGGRVAANLAALGVRQRLIVRDAGRAPHLPDAEIAIAAGYADIDAMTAALRGTDTLFLVSGRESPGRVAEHTSAVDAAVAAGVNRIVYVSFLNAAPDATFTLARDHWATEAYIRTTGVAFTFLQDSLYLDFIPLMTSPEGVIAGPAGDGVVACVARADIAAVAAAVITGDAHDGRTYRLTGPEAFSLSQAADTLSSASGRTIVYRNETLEEAYASRATYGAPAFEVDGWVTSYLAIANGELATISNDVFEILGRRPQTLAEFLKNEPASLEHLRAHVRDRVVE